MSGISMGNNTTCLGHGLYLLPKEQAKQSAKTLSCLHLRRRGRLGLVIVRCLDCGARNVIAPRSSRSLGGGSSKENAATRQISTCGGFFRVLLPLFRDPRRGSHSPFFCRIGIANEPSASCRLSPKNCDTRRPFAPTPPLARLRLWLRLIRRDAPMSDIFLSWSSFGGTR